MSPARAWRALVADERSLRRGIWAIALLALVARAAVIAVSQGGADLDVYYGFAKVILDGGNPWDLPAGSALDPFYATAPPGEFGSFAGLLAVHDAPETLRAAFALVDAAVIVLLGAWRGRPRAWRGAFALFYAFNPLVLSAWVWFAEDKPVVLLLVAATVIAVEGGRIGGAWLWTAALAAFKWIGAFYAPVLALHTARRDGMRRAAVLAGAFLAAFALSHAPWFPDNLDAYDIRSDRLAIDPPIHASLTIGLARLGLYDPAVARLLTLGSLALVFAAFAARRLRPGDAIVLTVVAAHVWLPDQAYNRVLMIAMPLLLVVAMDPRRWLLLWGVTTAAAGAITVSLYDGDLPALDWAAGPYGSLRHALWATAPLALLLWWWWRGRSAPGSGAAVEAAPGS